MSRVIAAHGRRDAMRCLVQPIGFSFEVDLVSRDWLLGGHAEATFHAPVYQQGVSAAWEDVDGDRFLDVIATERGAGRAVVFQTEWSLVSPDAGRGFGQGHVAAVLDQRGGELYVLDTVGARTAPAIFADDLCGWVPTASYADAACRRLQVLRYRIDPPARPWAEELRQVLARGVEAMTGRRDRYEPLLHVSEGLAGIDHFAEALARLPASYLADRQVRTLLAVRIPATIAYVIGNRDLLGRMVADTWDCAATTAIRAALGDSAVEWQRLTVALRQATRRQPPELDDAIEQVRRCGRAEAALVERVAEALQEL